MPSRVASLSFFRNRKENYDIFFLSVMARLQNGFVVPFNISVDFALLLSPLFLFLFLYLYIIIIILIWLSVYLLICILAYLLINL